MSELTSWLGLAALALCLALSTALMLSAFQIHRRISIVGAAFIAMLLNHGLTAVPYAAGMLGRDLVPIPLSPDFSWVLGASFALFAAGAWGTSKLARLSLGQMQDECFAGRPVSGAVNLTTLYTTTLVVAAIGLLYSFGTGDTGLSVLVDRVRDPIALKDFRVQFGTTNPYSYVGGLTTGVFAPLLLLIAINRSRAPASLVEKLALPGLALVTFTALLVASIAGVHKGPIVSLVLFLLLNRHLGRTSHPTVSGKFVAAISATLVALGVLGYYVTYDVDAGGAVNEFVNRIFVAPQVSLDSFLNVYPAVLPFNGGLGIGLFSKVLGVANFEAPSLLVGYLVTGAPNVNLNGFWSTDLWASFGYPGVVVGSLGVGALLTLIDYACLRFFRKTAVGDAVYAFMVVTAINVGEVSIFTMLLSGGLVIGPLFGALVQLGAAPPATPHLNPDRRRIVALGDNNRL